MSFAAANIFISWDMQNKQTPYPPDRHFKKSLAKNIPQPHLTSELKQSFIMTLYNSCCVHQFYGIKLRKLKLQEFVCMIVLCGVCGCVCVDEQAMCDLHGHECTRPCVCVCMLWHVWACRYHLHHLTLWTSISCFFFLFFFKQSSPCHPFEILPTNLRLQL